MNAKNQNDILANYYDELANLIEHDDNLVNELLINEGLSIEQESQKSKMLINRLETQLKAKLKREKYTKALFVFDRIKKRFENRSEEFVQQLLDKPEYVALKPLFNKLKKVTPADIQSMVSDAELLRILENLEKESDQDESR